MNLIVLWLALFAQGPRDLASALRPGMQLVYGAGEQLQAPWVIDSVVRGPRREWSDCAVIHLQRQPGRPEEQRLCVARDTMYRWRAADSTWAITRPVGPNMTWRSARPAGGRVEYRTGLPSSDTISGVVLAVVPTVVTTTDSTGRAIRRLRERYAVAIATATGGTFEEADAAAPDGWRVTQTFSLREIRPPSVR